jgi:hypothetical protein
MAGEQDYDRTAGRGIQSEKEPVQFMGTDVAPSIAGGAEHTFVYEPDYDMNPVGFRAPTAALAEAFAIVGMKIGPVSVMAGSGPFPLSAFLGESFRFALALPVTSKAPLKVTVRNMTTGGIAGLYLGVLGKVKRAQ